MTQRIAFTHEVIGAIEPPAAGRSVWRDTKVQGLELRVSAAGVKSFSFCGRAAGGRMERTTLGRYPAMAPERARKIALQMAGTLATGASVAEQKRARRDEMTVGELFELYMDTRAAGYRRPDKLRALWRLHVAGEWAAKKLADVRPAAVARWHRALPERIKRKQADAPQTRAGDGRRTANQALKLLHALFRWGIEVARVHRGDNPAHGHLLFREASRDRFAGADELARLFAALADEPNEACRDLFALALLTGARRSNLLAMRWADVDLVRAEWRIPGEVTKNGDTQALPLVPEAMALLRERLAARAPGCPWVFASATSRTGHVADPKAAWARVLARAHAARVVDAVGAALQWDAQQLHAARLAAAAAPHKAIEQHRAAAARCGIEVDALAIADLRMHDLRRTVGSWQAKTGASLVVIGRSLNHRSTQATAIYARLDTDPVRQSMQRAVAAMREAAGLPAGSTGGGVEPPEPAAHDRRHRG